MEIITFKYITVQYFYNWGWFGNNYRVADVYIRWKLFGDQAKRKQQDAKYNNGGTIFYSKYSPVLENGG